MTQGLRRDKTRPAHLLTGHTGTKLALHRPFIGTSGTKLAQHRPFIGTSGTKLALHTIKRQFWALFRLRGEYSHARSLTKQSRAKIVTHRARQHKHSKETSPLREVLRAVVKHFSPTRVHKSQFWPFSTEQGRCFFHCGCMPGTGAIRWGDISFRTRPRRPIEPPILTHRTRDQQTGGTGVMGTEGHGRGRGAGGRRQGQNKHTHTKPHPIGGHRVACGARPRCRRAAAWPEQAHAHQAPPDWRPPRGLRGQAAVPEAAAGPGRASRSTTPSRRLACGDLAGGPPPTGTHSGPAHQGKPHGARNTRGSTSNAGDQAGPQAAPPQRAEGNPYSPRNALIAGISRTACTRPAR